MPMTQHKKVTKKVQIALGLAAAGLFLGACGSSDSATETSVEATETSVMAADCPAADLVDAAKAEGQVNLITLPDTWSNYKGILASYRDKYGIANPVANPDGSSADELTAVETLAGQPDMPDAVDV